MPGLGHKSWLQFGKEATYGGGAVATQRLELIKWNMQQNIGVIRDPSLYAGQSPRGLYQGGQTVTGTFTVRCNYEGLEDIFRGAMGTYGLTQQWGPVVGVTGCTLAANGNITLGSSQTNINVGAYVTATGGTGTIAVGAQVTEILDSTHLVVSGGLTAGSPTTVNFTHYSNDTFAYDGATLNSYSLEASEGDVTAGTCSKVVGAVFTGFTVKGVSGTGNDAMLTLDVTVLGKDMSKGVTPSRSQVVANCTLTAGTNSTVVTGFTNPTDPILVGQSVTGTGIPGTAIVVSVNATTPSLVLDRVCTNGTVTLTFSLSYPTLLPVLYHQSSTMVEGTQDVATSVRWRSFEVSVVAPHTEDRFYLGSVNIDQPLRSDFVTTKWKSVQEFTTLSQFNAAKNFLPTAGYKLIFKSPTFLNSVSISGSSISGTTMTLGANLTNMVPGSLVTGTGVTVGTTIVAGSGTSYTVAPGQTVGSTIITISAYRELELRSNSVRFTSYSTPVENYGVILSTAEAEAFKDPSDSSGLMVRIRNATPQLV